MSHSLVFLCITLPFEVDFLKDGCVSEGNILIFTVSKAGCLQLKLGRTQFLNKIDLSPFLRQVDSTAVMKVFQKQVVLIL